jgi:ABC-type multidrug transport system permease subunit
MSAATTTEAQRMGSGAIRGGWLITQRDLMHWVRQPAGPIFGIAFIVMLVLMFGFLLGGAIEIPGADAGDYLPFLMPGMFALTMLFGIDDTRAAMSLDATRGVTDRFRSMPISGGAVVLGRAGADLLYAVVSLAVLMGGGLLLGWRIESGFWPAVLAIGLLLWLRFAMIWVGIALGIALRSTGATQAVQILIWPIGFLSNAFVSTETMPAWLGAISQWNPLSATAAAVRELFGNPTGVTGGILSTHAVLLAILIPLLITAVFLPLSARAYRRLER